jgi:hypothetical protein
MFAALEGEGVVAEEAQPQLQEPGGGEEEMMQGRLVNVKLLEFWPHFPGLWYARAECRVEMMAVTSEHQKFCCVEDALTYESILCNHKPFSCSLGKAADAWSACQQRHLSYLAEITSDKWQENMVGNMLLWPAMVLAFVSPYSREKLDYSSVATKQATSQLVANLVRSSGLQVLRCMWGGMEMLCDLFTTNPKLLVPASFNHKEPGGGEEELAGQACQCKAAGVLTSCTGLWFARAECILK